ncbi:class I SAM-dependent methyltransferase [Maribacter halichondriae]|uniref:class I SAM-dependent methyltransferase n=1 Tax=Maribacter halichondriae TaxID=2980554 RepID=UPI00235A34B5|nr:methyltransferase domain-containing protein [Maribacter sp. Hal144]
MQQIAHKWDSALYNDKHSFVYDYGVALFDLLNPKSHERILDLGCGSGELTNKINEMASSVVGIDNSPEMIEKAKFSFPLCEFQVADAGDFEFYEPFDAIFSNAALHWVVDHKAAIGCMYKSLRSGGRMVVEFGGKDNVRTITDQLRKSLLIRGYGEQAKLQLWYFPSIGKYTSELEAAGFKVSFSELYDRPTELADKNTGIMDWLTMFAAPFFKDVDDSDVHDILIEVQESLRSDLFRNGKWFADYKRIRIVAHR